MSFYRGGRAEKKCVSTPQERGGGNESNYAFKNSLAL